MKIYTRGIVPLIAILLCTTGCSVFSGAKVSSAASSFAPNKDFVRNADNLSSEEENVIGRAVAAHILSRYKPSTNKRLNEYVSEVGHTVAASSARPNTFSGYSFLVLESDEINALAAPGGYIFITTGLLKLLKDEDALAAVLAHEVTHVTQRHGLKAIKPDHYANYLKVGAYLVSAIDCTGLSTQLLVAFDGAVGDVLETLLKSGYSREQEFEADLGAASVLNAAGYHVDSLEDLLFALDKNLGDGGWLSTHPSASDRREALALQKALNNDDSVGHNFRKTRFQKIVKEL